MKHLSFRFQPRTLPLLTGALALLLATGAGAQGLRLSGSLGSSGMAPPSGLGGLPRPADAAPAAPGSEQADYIVAVVNSEPITNSEVNMRADRAAQQIEQQGVALPPRNVLLRQVLGRLINEKAQLAQARESGIKIDEASVDLAEQNVARQNNVDVAALRRGLASDGISNTRFRDDLRNQITLMRLREREVESRLRLSDQDIDQFIREQQQAGVEIQSLELNLQHVLVLVPENASPQKVAELQKRAQDVADSARAGTDFAVLAKEKSDAPEGRDGGLLGLRPADRYPPLFVDAVRNVAVGGIVGPIRSPAGFHVLKVAQKVSGGITGEVLQSHARHILLRASPQLTEQAAIERLADYKRRIVAGQADFAELAKSFSVDGSAKQGGDLGWVNPGQFVPEFEDVMAGLQPGQISDPVVSRFGVHLIQLLERRPHTLTQREQRDMARAAAREKKLDENFTTWAQEVRGRAYVELREPPK